MDSNKYMEQINEVKYLTQENTKRYRLIIRYLFNKYEEAEYWQYKEEIYNEVKKTLSDYTEDECNRDLEFLLANGSISNLQDIQNINTLNDFKYKNYRYQITNKAVVIERMTIELEEIEVKVTALEKRLFERISNILKKLTDIYSLEERQIYELWTDINNDFKSLNETYKDFLKQFHEAKTEELLQSTTFLEFKSSVINYINDFINSYINSSTKIKNYLIEIDEEKTEYLMNSLISYQKKAPKVSLDFNYEKLKKLNYNKWQSLKNWFISTKELCEGDRLLEATQAVIQKIYKYASSLIELHGNMINRKEEYKHVCNLFDKVETDEEAHKLSGAIFGITTCRHYKVSPMINTESLIKSYDIKPIEINITSALKEYKVNNFKTVIIDKTTEKEHILNNAIEQEKKRKIKIKELIKTGKIELKNEILLDETERRYVLNLIEKYNEKKVKESEFGYSYYIENSTTNNKCKIISPDGIFELKEQTIIIEVGEE